MKPLLNKNILVTKKRNTAYDSLRLLEDAGAEIIFFPTIKVKPIAEFDEIKKALGEFTKFNYIIFTSSNAVEVFDELSQKHQLSLYDKKVAAVGKSTAAKCKGLGIQVDVIPDEFSAQGLVKTFSELEIKGKQILIPGSSLSRVELAEGLTKFGAEVTTLPIYDVVSNNARDLKVEIKHITERRPDVFVFTSPSSFDSFIKIMNITDASEYFDKSTICSIGKTTESAIRDKSLPVHIVPETFSLDSIATAIIKYFQVTSHVA